jgi:3-deoxy-D-manno-octulosonate 8-phosphate phosphatase (KDO 8-P phosphatase)
MTKAPAVDAPRDWTKTILEKAAPIRLLVLDVDGVMTGGQVFFSAQGDELKAFNILDGQGIKILQRQGVQVAIITGRTSPLTARRANDLGIEHLYQGREDKLVAVKELCAELQLSLHQVAYLGDDLPDLSAIRAVGLGITVPNAYWLVHKHACCCTRAAGGEGAVREVADLLLTAKGQLDSLLQTYL